MSVSIGLDRLAASGYAALRGHTIALLCNQASVDARYQHIIELLLPGHHAGDYRIGRVFGPEHGLYGHTQDNMIEWEGETDPRTGLSIQSLYGEHRKPTPAMLDGIDLFVVDIPDVGSRYYTFVWTMAHCMETCAELGIPVLVLDRPNPIGGTVTEGTVLKPGLESFVGLYPVPTRHHRRRSKAQQKRLELAVVTSKSVPAGRMPHATLELCTSHETMCAVTPAAGRRWRGRGDDETNFAVPRVTPRAA